MRIQSRFRDYYDFISHRFGQQPDVVYVRDKIKETNILFPSGRAGRVLPDVKRMFRDDVRGHIDFVVAAQRVIPLYVVHDQTFDVETNQYNPATVTYEWLGPQHRRLVKDFHEDVFARLLARPPSPRLPDLIRAVGAPVFYVTDQQGDHIVVAERVPVLKDLGFPAHIAPEVMWQEIFSTLTDVLRKNPDKEPPVMLSNNDRIHAAGFDLKSSFRHPVNQKKPKKTG